MPGSWSPARKPLGYSLADSPAGLAAWFYDKFADWTHTGGMPEQALSRDEMLDDITLYWLTNTGTSGARLYWENNANNFNAVDISHSCRGHCLPRRDLPRAAKLDRKKLSQPDLLSSGG